MPDNRVEFYRDTAREWRWRFIAAENGNVLADSGEGYVDLADAQMGFDRVMSSGLHPLTFANIGYEEDADDAPGGL